MSWWFWGSLAYQTLFKPRCINKGHESVQKCDWTQLVGQNEEPCQQICNPANAVCNNKRRRFGLLILAKVVVERKVNGVILRDHLYSSVFKQSKAYT